MSTKMLGDGLLPKIILIFDVTGKKWMGKDATDYLITKCLNSGNKFPSWYVQRW
jgi:hypothetical protein